jgi:hypothetical protein
MPWGWFTRGSVFSAGKAPFPVSALAVPRSDPKPPAGLS